MGLAGKQGRAALVAAMLVGATAPAAAWDRNNAEAFAVLPAGAGGPEGLTVGTDGALYVTTQGGAAGSPGRLTVFEASGRLLRDVPVQGGSPSLLGLAFNPVTRELLVADAGAGVVRRVDPLNGASSVFMTTTGGGALNGLAFDGAGNTYVTDSRQGIVWVAGPEGGAGRVWAQDPLLTTTGVPRAGANGIGFNRDGSAAFVANTGDDTIIRIPVEGAAAGQPAVFVNSVNGADGLVLDGADNIWAAANQSDEIVVIDPTGKAIAKLGDFNGIRDGRVQGLLFPATPAFSVDGQFVYVTNFAQDLRRGGGVQSVVSQYAAQVTQYTVARISTRFRPVQDGSRRAGRED